MWFVRKQKMQPTDPQVRINSAALSCQSVINPIGTAGFLTEALALTQQWTVVPDSDRITLPYQ